MTVETSKTIEVRKSPATYSSMAVGGVVLIGISYLFANGDMVDTRRGGPWTIPFGWFCIFFWGACLLTILGDLLLRPATVLTLSPSGLRDQRFSPDELPWTKVTGVRERKSRNYRCMILEIEQDALIGMQLNWRFRFWRKPNALIGAKGVWITAIGLETSFNNLFYDVLAYARAHSPHVAASVEDEQTLVYAQNAMHTSGEFR